MRTFLTRAFWLVLVLAFAVAVTGLPLLSLYEKQEVERVARLSHEPPLSTEGGNLEDTYRVLLVSDLHLDLLGAMLIRGFAKEYRANLVINTGDVGVLGKWPEGQLAKLMLADSPPQVLVPGNHDHGSLIGDLSKNMIVLDDRSVNIDGLEIYGLADPVSRLESVQPDQAKVEDAAAMAAGGLRERIRDGAKTPDIVAVHSGAMATYFTRLTPLIVYGHSHKQSVRTAGDCLLVNSGSVNALQFLRFFPPKVGLLPARTLTVLYYTDKLPRRLVAIDEIQLGDKGDARLSRLLPTNEGTFECIQVTYKATTTKIANR